MHLYFNTVPNPNATQLVLFDFDGTLTKEDSFLAFLRCSVALPKLVLGSILLAFAFVALLLRGKLNAETAKKRVLRQFFKGRREEEMEHLGYIFFRRKLPSMLRINVLRLLRHYQKQADTQVVLVSASADAWLLPFCRAERIALICSELAYVDGRFQGDFIHGNCNRAAKVQRIRAAFDLKSFKSIRAYGNSAGDQAMFDLADEAWLVKGSGVMVQLKSG